MIKKTVAPPVQQSYYQVDTWQGRWLAAERSGGLCAFAVDGQMAGSTNPRCSSGLIKRPAPPPP